MYDNEQLMRGGAIFLLLGLVSLFAYFFPTIVGLGRRHHNVLAIFALNFFLGWTLIGWVVALVWACLKSPERERSDYDRYRYDR